MPARTEAEALELFDEMQSLINPVVGRAQPRRTTSTWISAEYPLDGPFPELTADGVGGIEPALRHRRRGAQGEADHPPDL